MQPEPIKTDRKPLVEAFSELPDPRVVERCDHLLHEVLVIAVCGMLVGGESFYDMEDFAHESEGWLRGFLTTLPPCAASPSTCSAPTNPPPKASIENVSAAPSTQTTSPLFSHFDASALVRGATLLLKMTQ